MVRFGWMDRRRIRAISLCVRVQNGRVLIEEDWTDWGIVDRLIEFGVPAEHILLRFHRGNLTAAECK
jgi:XisI protein